MGMFDYLSVQQDKLPLTEFEVEDIFREIDGHKPEFQTKDFDCQLTLVHINDSSIVIDAPYINTQEPSTVISDFHGFVHFYGHGRSKWFYEFKAKYTDGNLVGIYRLYDLEAYWNKDRQSVNPKAIES